MKKENKNGIINAFVIQIINTFIEGIIYILIPFLMLERNISVESMGLIFAILPLVQQTNRIIFGMISDFLGRKKFYWLNGILNFVYLIIYYFSKSPFGFLMGKVSQGLKSASLWSVNRAYLLDYYIENKEETLVKLRAYDTGFNALGMLIAGFLIATFSYDKTLLILILLSIVMLPSIKVLKDKNKEDIKILEILKTFDFKSKSKKFKKFFFIFFILGFYWGLIGGYIFPLFLKEAGFAKESIGLLLGTRALIGGIAMYALKSVGRAKDKLLIGGILSALIVVLYPFVDINTLSVLVIFTGIFNVISGTGQEAIFAQTADSNSLAGDIGLLLTGAHVGMAITQAFSGFLISSFGFPFMFFLSSILRIIFSWLAFSNMD